MTKEEIIQELKKGTKVQHRFFLHEEFMFQPDNRVEVYEFEDGVLIDAEDFWKDRNTEYWERDWKIFN